MQPFSTILSRTWVNSDVSSSNPLPKVILASSPCFPATFHFNKETPGSHHLPSIYLIAQFQCTHIVVLELLTTKFIALSTIAHYLGTVPLAFSLRDATHFQSDLGQPFSPTHYNEVVSYTFLIQLDCFVTFSFHPGIFRPSEWLFIYILANKITSFSLNMGLGESGKRRSHQWKPPKERFQFRDFLTFLIFALKQKFMES